MRMNEVSFPVASAVPTEPQSSEQVQRRSAVRRRTLKEGKIVVSPPTGTVDVLIRDMSETGAKLEVDPALVLPDRFELVVVSDQGIVLCQLAWRKRNFAGLQFVYPAKKITLKKY